MVQRNPPPGDDQLELFSAVFTDIASRETRETMELPFLSLSKRPRFQAIRYTSPKGIEVTVSGGEPHGIASIFDWDLVIWLMSQIRHAVNNGQEVSRKIRFSRWAFLKSVRRHTGGDEYRRLEASIARLKNTTVTTNIRAKQRRTVMFNWFEYVDIERDEKGRLQNATVVLPEWLFEAVCDHKLVLTLHPDYFLLTGGIERWLYRIVRKGAGKQLNGWDWKLRALHERSGSTQSYKYFARDVRKLIAEGTLLDYELSLVESKAGQSLHAKRIQSQAVEEVATVPTIERPQFLRLSTVTYEKAKLIAPGFDIYALEQQWKEFNAGKEAEIRKADSAFLAFCRVHAQRNPIPAR